MRIQISDNSVNLWLSARDTYNWATRPTKSWPCSQLRGNRVFAAFDRNGLCDFSMNGKDSDVDCTELGACCADHMAAKLPKNHPCYDVAVGQFIE